ncbi:MULTISPECIES: RHS repeat-associated core domain-containing protein [unclassified Lentimonas]|uniref:RHS repeat-associated core domain-containing protein n=1 Tax=unclassified Lentimonas TaxID=2630993 RepID=UPI00132C7603|nr:MULTISPECIES: RHS repeat-associated core domain-containing protein [unclassified Lentimonas]CAA6677045.1 Unannotated [Lentimonas sp. CC4]CAA6687238.1 Unannotated [Lentimonas sp. CC6]CAA7074361.1 Unannotated [Lentimonas sp. CC4]CAA7171458.1 Unannotated [Lentimonas sp. CC21]CAA7180046.1 Unannotated [Lentimonas sp. CC8]
MGYHIQAQPFGKKAPTTYAYDAPQIVDIDRRIRAKNQPTSTYDTPSIVDTNHLPTTVKTGAPAQQQNPTSIRSQHYDSNSKQSPAYVYGPFGELIRATDSKKDDFNFRFSTKYEDAETGLLYYGFRYYDPVTGRWPSRDPIQEFGGYNIYGMVGNNHLCHTDYLGQGPWESFAQGVVQAAVAVGTAVAVSAAVVALVGTAPITVTGLVAIGVVAGVTGMIQGAQTDSVVDALGHGVTNGLIQGTVGGAGAAFSAAKVTVNSTVSVTRLATANGVVNVTAANISVAMSDSRDRPGVYVFASVTALAFSSVSFWGGDSINSVAHVMLNLDAEIIVTAGCVGGDEWRNE